MLLDALKCVGAMTPRAGGDFLTLWFLHSTQCKEREGVGAAKRENARILEMSATDNVLTRRGGQSVCKQSWEYAWAGCSNPGNR